MIQEAIFKVVDKQDLTFEESYEAISEIMSGQTSEVQTAALLAALSTKSSTAETADEIAGAAAAMREKATPVVYDQPVLEIVGTGGDRAGSFNISTTASIIIAAGGVKVAKHGNRAASSQSGAADCLEALGVNLNQPPELCVAELNEIGICFLFAQYYHKAMRYVGGIRKELGIRTVFNILGPLTNPANPTYMVLGVYSDYLLEPLASVISKLGVRHAVIVHGEAGLDELSSACVTKVCEVNDGTFTLYEVTPEQFGFERCTRDDLKGGTAQDNAQITRDILSGADKSCRRDTVLMNAGAGLYVGGVAKSLEEGVRMAADLVDTGKALATLEAYIEKSNS